MHTSPVYQLCFGLLKNELERAKRPSGKICGLEVQFIRRILRQNAPVITALYKKDMEARFGHWGGIKEQEEESDEESNRAFVFIYVKTVEEAVKLQEELYKVFACAFQIDKIQTVVNDEGKQLFDSTFGVLDRDTIYACNNYYTE